DLKPFHDLPEWQELRKNLPKEEEGANPKPARAAARPAGAAAALKNMIQQRIKQIAPQKK
ncbi:MAG: hypothetical protein ACKOFW_19935, partial [Planctomycetaceae bacterium]